MLCEENLELRLLIQPGRREALLVPSSIDFSEFVRIPMPGRFEVDCVRADPFGVGDGRGLLIEDTAGVSSFFASESDGGVTPGCLGTRSPSDGTLRIVGFPLGVDEFEPGLEDCDRLWFGLCSQDTSTPCTPSILPSMTSLELQPRPR